MAAARALYWSCHCRGVARAFRGGDPYGCLRRRIFERWCYEGRRRLRVEGLRLTRSRVTGSSDGDGRTVHRDEGAYRGLLPVSGGLAAAATARGQCGQFGPCPVKVLTYDVQGSLEEGRHGAFRSPRS